MANQFPVDLTSQVNARSIAPAANLPEDALEHRHVRTYAQAGGADVVAASEIIHRAYAGGTVLGITATPDAVPAGGTKSITIDVHRSTGGGSWASILASTTTLDSTAITKTPVALSVSPSISLVAGDIVKIIITTTGSGGTNVQGLLIDMVVAENCV